MRAAKLSCLAMPGFNRREERRLVMKMTEVQKKAKELGIKTEKLKKTELIRKIQTEEGNQPCFQMNGGSCDQVECCWRKDCLI